MINSRKIKERAKELGIRQADIAMAWGIKQSSANQKINNVRPMYLQEAEILADTLQISNEEFADYFLARECVAQQYRKEGRGK